MRAIKMGMANHNSLQTSFRLDECDRLIINESNEIPEYVPRISLNEDRPLTYTQLLPRRGAIGETRRQVSWDSGCGRNIMDSGIVLVGRKFVLLLVGFIGETCPGLTAYWDILTGVLGVVSRVVVMGWRRVGGCVIDVHTSHMRQDSGGEERGASYWVPQVKHIARSALSKCMIALKVL
jgi:hypothetical protein